MSTAEAAIALAERGLPVFRLRRGTKNGFIDKNWAHEGVATTDVAKIREMFDGGDYNIGVNTSRLVVLDVDRKNGDGFADLMALVAANGDLPKTYTQGTPSGGLHIVFDAGDDRFGQRDLAPNINVRGLNGLIVGAGSEFEGKPYTVRVDAPIAPVPKWLRDLLQEAPTREFNAGKVVCGLDTDPATAAAVAYLTGSSLPAIEDEGGNNQTYRVAARCFDFGLSADKVLELMYEHWNDRCDPSLDYDDLEKIIRSAGVNRQKPIGCDNPADGFEAIELPEPAKPQSPWVFVEDEPDNTAVDWLIDELIPMGGVGFLAGASSSGKTFAMVDMAQALWRGVDWFGRKIDRPGGTYILAAEGGNSIAHRIKASGHFRFGEKLKDAKRGPIICRKSAPDLKTPNGRSAFKEELQQANKEMLRRYGVPIRLVSIETFAQTFDVRDENAASDVSSCIKIMKEISSWLPEPPAVMASHHFGKYTDGMRGSGAFRDNSDFVIEVQKDGVLFLEKSKESTDGCPLGCFEMPCVTLSYKPDGRAITSRYVKQVAQPAAAKAAKHQLDAAFVEAFNACAKDMNGVRVASRDEMRKLMYQCWPNESTNTKRGRFNRKVKEATVAGFAADMKWVTERGVTGVT